MAEPTSSSSQRRVRRQYEPPPTWEELADRYQFLLSNPQAESHDDLLQAFEPADGGFVGINFPFRLEQAARVAASSRILELPPHSVVERAVATQWYLDKNLATGLELVLHGEGRFRRAVRLPVTPRSLAG